jgi:hypothetical protein
LRFGDTEIVLSEVAINEALDELPTTEAKAEYATEISSQVEPPAREVIAEAFGSHILYEQAVRRALIRVSNPTSLQWYESAGPDRGYDGVLSIDDIVIYVEVKSRPTRGTLDAAVVRNLMTRLREEGLLLIVTNVNPTTAAAEAALSLVPRIQIAKWSSESDDATLALALGRLVAHQG